MSHPLCPLCRSEKPQRLESVAVPALVAQYRRLLGADVSGELPSPSLERLRCPECDLVFFHPVQLGSSAFYELIQSRFHEYYPAEKFDFAFAREFVQSGERVLEIGCGDGHFARQVSPERYLGLELSPKAAERARSGGYQILEERLEEFAGRCTLRFDVICAFQVLEHLSSVDEFLSCVERLLAPGGRFILTVPSGDSFLSHVVNNVMNMPPHHQSVWSDDAIRHIGVTTGLVFQELRHEPAWGDQARWYLATLFHRRLRNCMQMPFQSVDNSKRNLVLRKCAGFLARCFAGSLREPYLCPSGHTVGAVFRKP